MELKLQERGCDVEEDSEVGGSVPGCWCHHTYVGWKKESEMMVPAVEARDLNQGTVGEVPVVLGF